MACPEIRFFVSGESGSVSAGTDLWKRPLLNPEILSPLAKNGAPEEFAKKITIGDYLTAAQKFISAHDFKVLINGLNIQSHVRDMGQVRHVDLRLEKHGAFYHPIKVVTRLFENNISQFVLNGAVSKRGLAILQNEFQMISMLNEKYPDTFLPRVYGCEQMDVHPGCIGFFLGEWFEGYDEFHLTRDNIKNQVVIWGTDGGVQYIEENEIYGVYQKIAAILTFYYDLETYSQIYPWHHAAGDFILKKGTSGYDVRLITVRGYQNLTEFGPSGNEDKVMILPALMVFFLHLTIRIRLDRLNGTGRPALLGEEVIPYVVAGFLQGMASVSKRYEYGDIGVAFISFMMQFSVEQMAAVVENILESCPLTGPEMDLVLQGLESHLEKITAVLKTL